MRRSYFRKMFGLDVDKNIISYVVLLKFTMCVTA